MTPPAPPLPAPSVGHLLRDRARRTPDRRFLRFEGERVTFAEADARVNRVANSLDALGIGPGDRVAIMLPNGLDYPLTWLAVLSLGAVVVPMNTSYRERDLVHTLTDSGARLAVTDPTHAPSLLQALPRCLGLERILVWDHGEPAPPGSCPLSPIVATASAVRDPAGLEPADLAVVQYTSGTTGFPKGCMLPHGLWLRTAVTMAGPALLGEDDVAVIMTAFYYADAGWNLCLSLLTGMELVILPRFSASGFWRSVRDSGATFFYCLGTMPVLLLKQPEQAELDRGHRMRRVICSGIPPQQHAAIERRWGVPWREAYGTTETGFVLMTRPEETETVGSGSVGRPIPGYEMRIVDAAGRDVPNGVVGQLLVRGPDLSQGYWNQPEATAAWRRDGWARTGDLFRVDRHGRYYLVGRIKDMIRRGGENISAVEVESVLAEHPAVRGAACVAVPDEIRGEEVKAFVQLLPGETPETAPPEAILTFCRDRLARFKVPRYLTYVAEFPMTPSQRIEKHRLVQAGCDGRAGTYDAATGTWL